MLPTNFLNTKGNNMIINDFFDKNQDFFYDQPFSYSYFDKIKNLSFEKQYAYFYYCYYNLFYIEFNDFSLYCEQNKIVTIEEAEKYKNYDDLNKTFECFIKVYEEILNSGLSVKKFFDINKNLKMCYKTFYNIKSKLLHVTARYRINFENAFYKSRKPKKIKRTYDHKHRVMIVNFFVHERNKKIFNKTNIWLKLVNNKNLNKEYDFSRLTYATMMKIVQQELGETNLHIKKFRTKHEFINLLRRPGDIQVDVKVLGKYEQQIKSKIRLFVARDRSTRLAFVKVLYRETEQEIVCALEESRLWFKKQGIKILSIQTDNAMVFKKTNFVHSKIYFKWCHKHNIVRRYIKLKHPESNGIVERFNKMIDDEWHEHLMKCEDFNQIVKTVMQLTYIYNYCRYMHYCELSNKKYNIKYKDRFMIPSESLNIINNLL